MILDETQDQRDKELSDITGVDINQIKKYEIAGPDSIRVFAGNNIPTTEQGLENLYRDYKNLNLVAYLRTLMKTSIYSRHPELINLIRKTTKSSCLDFGSGVGTHAVALAENKNLVTILDVPGPLIDFTINRFKHRNLSYTRLNNNDELPENEYDIVICTDVLEHVFDPIKEINRIHKSLKIGGKLHLQVSQMKKNSSGHFEASIDKWNKSGPSFLKQRFEKNGNTIFIKRN